MCRFAESFRSLHSKKLQAAEDKSVEMFINGDMPAARGKKKRKPMTEVHRRAIDGVENQSRVCTPSDAVSRCKRRAGPHTS